MININLKDTTFAYLTAVKNWNQLWTRLPKHVLDQLGVEERDELCVLIWKTGRTIPKREWNPLKGETKEKKYSKELKDLELR